MIPNGFGLVTVPASGVGNIGWDTLTLTNIPIMPFGCVAELILFSEFVDVTARWPIRAGRTIRGCRRSTATTRSTCGSWLRSGTTRLPASSCSRPTRTPISGTPTACSSTPITSMAPSARYLAGGDLRVGALHGVTSPCAIVICPVGDAANFDKNVSDEPVTSATFTNTNFFMRITETVGGAKDLVLYTKQAIGGVAIGTTTYNLSTTYRTLQALVDAINTSVAAGADGRQWKAQLAPGVDPNASTDDLLAHRLIAPGVVSHTNNSPTITVGDLANEWSRLAVGAWVEAPAAIAGRYIKSKDTRTLVAGLPVEGTCTLDGNATATGGPVQLIVYLDSGDAGLSALAEPGIQRVFGPMTPGFLYFKSTYFDRQLAADKQALWTTQGGPNLPRAAGNSWTTRVSGKHRPSAGAGIGVGLVPVQDGFVCGYADHVWKLVNTTNTNDTRDENYRLEPLDLEDGVKSWGGMVKGPNCAIWCGRVGVYAGDLVRKFMISKAIWNASERRGPVRFEIESSALATSRDDDTAYLKLEVVRDRLNVFYRADEAATYPNRRMVYDFSGAVEAQGALQMVDAGDNPFQWSTQFLQSLSALALIRRGDGERVVGILDTNAGTIGDGRAEYVDTGNTDNGVAIVARLYLRTDDLGDRRKKKSAQEFVLRYRAAVGQLLLRVSRDYGRLSELTHTVPQTGPSEIRTKRIPLKMQLRAPADFVEVVIEDTGQPVAASEVHFGALEYLTLPSY